MKRYTTLLLLLFTLYSCKSVSAKIKENKEKFIQVAKENSKPVEIADIYEQAKSNNVEGKMKYLGVDNIETVYGLDKSLRIKLDSIVVFTKSHYKIIYDFATTKRPSETIAQNCGLTDFEKIDERLYIGKE